MSGTVERPAVEATAWSSERVASSKERKMEVGDIVVLTIIRGLVAVIVWLLTGIVIG
jgi:hypothetical protein